MMSQLSNEQKKMKKEFLSVMDGDLTKTLEMLHRSIDVTVGMMLADIDIDFTPPKPRKQMIDDFVNVHKSVLYDLLDIKEK